MADNVTRRTHAPRPPRLTQPVPHAAPAHAAPEPASHRTAYSSESGRTYRLDKRIGKGGFGEVYLATTIGGPAFPGQVCIKISDRISGWLREAYFADLLAREDRALRVLDRFAEADGDEVRYCLAIEYAEHGDLGAWLAQRGAQSERFVRREIAAVLSALDAVASRPGAAPRPHAIQRLRVRG